MRILKRAISLGLAILLFSENRVQVSATVLAQSDLETCTLRTNNQPEEEYEETLDCDNKLVLLLSIES